MSAIRKPGRPSRARMLAEQQDMLAARVESLTGQKPCDFPCPKCGSVDILRSFWAKGERRQAREYDRQTMGKYVGVSCWNAHANRDHLVHHCRCCQYEWQTLPMKAQKRAIEVPDAG